MTKNDLYDMRILSDNPRDFSNTSTVLSGVNIGEKAKELLKGFKRDRDIRETGSGEDLRASLRASMMDDERSFRQSGRVEEELDWLGVEVEERGEVEASPPRPRPPLSVPLSPRVKAENNGGNSPRVRRGGTRNSPKRPPSLSLSYHDHDHDEQSIGDLDLRDVVTPSIIPPAPPMPKQVTIDFSRVEDLGTTAKSETTSFYIFKTNTTRLLRSLVLRIRSRTNPPKTKKAGPHKLRPKLPKPKLQHKQ